MLDKKVIYFITVVEEKSFSKAAKKLYMSQPNLSKQVTLLEKELGILLLDRAGYRPVLTCAGEYYYQKIKKIQASLIQIEQELHKINHKEIRMGFTGSYENKRILEAINHIRNHFKNEKLTFEKYNFGDSMTNLLNKKIDISFGVESNFRKHPEVIYEALYSYEMCVICSYDHPLSKESCITPDQLKDQDFIVLSRKNGVDFYNDFIEACKLDGYIPNIKKEVDSFDELVFEVSLGVGIAIVSKDVVRESDVKVINLKESNHASRYVIAKLKANHDSVIDRLFYEIKDYFLKNNN